MNSKIFDLVKVVYYSVTCSALMVSNESSFSVSYIEAKFVVPMCVYNVLDGLNLFITWQGILIHVVIYIQFYWAEKPVLNLG